MKIPCSNCNQRLEIPEELAGQTIECPACKASLTVPSLQPPPVTPQVQVTTPQAAAPQKTAPQRKTSTALKAASSKKSKLPIPKWAIAAVGGVTVMALVIYFLSGPSVDIWEAAEEGNIEAVKQAIADGADVNAKANDGWTPLHWAAWKSHKEIAELLLANGADVNAKNDVGDTPLDYWAEMNTEGETADILRKHGGKAGEELKAEDGSEADRALIEATATGSVEAIKKAITDGADVNAKDEDGRTPLLHAAYQGNNEIAELLLANGADVNAKNEVDTTPLHHAALYGHKETVELFITNGADVNAIIVSGQYQGKTPLDLAIQLKRTETANLLRKHGGKTGEELKAEGK